MPPDPEVVDGCFGETQNESKNDKVVDDAIKSDTKLIDLSAENQQKSRRRRPRALLTVDIPAEPVSPSSSSSTSQAYSADVTFEPTIDMMVNDFDDEQTLNEEEALASTELQDPQNEIDTLKAESEMPIEELLAKYQSIASLEENQIEYRPKKQKKRKNNELTKSTSKKNCSPVHFDYSEQVHDEDKREKTLDISSENVSCEIGSNLKVLESENEVELSITTPACDDDSFENADELCTPIKKTKLRRSHLLDLYPDETFITETNKTEKNAISVNYEEEEDESEDEDDNECFKKSVMVGSLYQAVIPDGLSQYGDILPYENEDKLVWEPSQASERELEEYLLKYRGMKSSSTNESIAEKSNEPSTNPDFGNTPNDDIQNKLLESNGVIKINSENTNGQTDSEANGVIKDDEQALHLLVQCGYDFKEALRRKKLNAVPLSGSMSSWSEEECLKFEEGIQRYGKDFLKIRQNLVRTRSMRELVHFYYLWKKSERRDHNFANADTVDHMDIYLNEDGDYGSTPSTTANKTSTITGVPGFGTKKNTASGQNNFLIMAGGSAPVNNFPKVNGSRKQKSSTVGANSLTNESEDNFPSTAFP